MPPSPSLWETRYHSGGGDTDRTGSAVVESIGVSLELSVPLPDLTPCGEDLIEADTGADSGGMHTRPTASVELDALVFSQLASNERNLVLLSSEVLLIGLVLVSVTAGVFSVLPCDEVSFRPTEGSSARGEA